MKPFKYKYNPNPVKLEPTTQIRLFRFFYEPILVKRFRDKVDQRGPDECWPWIGSCDSSGYGKMKLGPATLVKASRIAYLLHHDADPAHMLVLHKCDNPKCVNPHHLFLGTHKENVADKIRKGRHRNASTGPITVGDHGRKTGTDG